MWPDNIALTSAQIDIIRKIRNLHKDEWVLYHTNDCTKVQDHIDPDIAFIFKVAWEAEKYHLGVCMQKRRGKFIDYYVIGVSQETKKTLERIQERL